MGIGAKRWIRRQSKGIRHGVGDVPVDDAIRLIRTDSPCVLGLGSQPIGISQQLADRFLTERTLDRLRHALELGTMNCRGFT